MIYISKKFTFDMAHMLENHPSKCKNLHGHTYKLYITVGRDELDNDMVIDFKDLKNIVEKNVIDKLDHSFAYNLNTNDILIKDIVNLLKKNGRKVYGFKSRTTCEVMTKEIWDILFNLLKDNGLVLVNIKLYEGEGSYAEYKG